MVHPIWVSEVLYLLVKYNLSDFLLTHVNEQTFPTSSIIYLHVDFLQRKDVDSSKKETINKHHNIFGKRYYSMQIPKLKITIKNLILYKMHLNLFYNVISKHPVLLMHTFSLRKNLYKEYNWILRIHI